MTLVWKTSLVRLLTAALLLATAPDASKVVCVSPAGHEAVEDRAALCCAPGGSARDTSFSETTPCQNCTDYPVASTVEIKKAEPSRVVTFDSSALPMMVPIVQDQATAIAFAPSVGRQFDPLNSPLSSAPLRC